MELKYTYTTMHSFNTYMKILHFYGLYNIIFALTDSFVSFFAYDSN